MDKEQGNNENGVDGLEKEANDDDENSLLVDAMEDGWEDELLEDVIEHMDEDGDEEDVTENIVDDVKDGDEDNRVPEQEVADLEDMTPALVRHVPAAAVPGAPTHSSEPASTLSLSPVDDAKDGDGDNLDSEQEAAKQEEELEPALDPFSPVDSVEDGDGDVFDSEQERANREEELEPAMEPTAAAVSSTPTKRSVSTSILSPFSPVLLNGGHRSPHDDASEQDVSGIENVSTVISLNPCRKVSAMARILPPTNPTKTCIFPLLHQQQMNKQQQTYNPHGLVVVNPSAMGQQRQRRGKGKNSAQIISTEVTMETARLVAQVAHLESEDWLRKYEMMDHVEWSSNAHNDNATTAAGPAAVWSWLAQSLAHDLMDDSMPLPQHRVCIGMGPPPFPSSTKERSTTLLDCLLFPTYEQIKRQSANTTSPRCTLSVFEIVDEDTLEDWLVHVNGKSQASKLRLRHADSKGAFVENLTQVEIGDERDLEVRLMLLLKLLEQNS